MQLQEDWIDQQRYELELQSTKLTASNNKIESLEERITFLETVIKGMDEAQSQRTFESDGEADDRKDNGGETDLVGVEQYQNERKISNVHSKKSSIAKRQCKLKIPYFRNFKFVRVCVLFGRYFYNMYIVKKL